MRWYQYQVGWYQHLSIHTIFDMEFKKMLAVQKVRKEQKPWSLTQNSVTCEFWQNVSESSMQNYTTKSQLWLLNFKSNIIKTFPYYSSSHFPVILFRGVWFIPRNKNYSVRLPSYFLQTNLSNASPGNKALSAKRLQVLKCWDFSGKHFKCITKKQTLQSLTCHLPCVWES